MINNRNSPDKVQRKRLVKNLKRQTKHDVKHKLLEKIPHTKKKLFKNQVKLVSDWHLHHCRGFYLA